MTQLRNGRTHRIPVSRAWQDARSDVVSMSVTLQGVRRDGVLERRFALGGSLRSA